MMKEILVIKTGFSQYRWALVHNNEVTYLDQTDYPSPVAASEHASEALAQTTREVISNISYCGLEEVLNEFLKKDKETA